MVVIWLSPRTTSVLVTTNPTLPACPVLGMFMPRNEFKGRFTQIRPRLRDSKIAETATLMTAKEIRARIAQGFPALPLEIQDAYVCLMEASLAKLQTASKGPDKSSHG